MKLKILIILFVCGGLCTPPTPPYEYDCDVIESALMKSNKWREPKKKDLS